MNKILYFNIFILFISFFSTQKMNAQGKEYWAIVGVKKEFTKVDLLLLNMNFFKPHKGWFQNNTRLVTEFKSKTPFSFGVGYQHEYVEFDTRSRNEHRPMLFLFYRKNFGAFDLQDMSTIEFRLMEGDLFNRYRNELQLRYNEIGFLKPYMSTELFLDVDYFEYQGQRTNIGTEIPLKNGVVNIFSFYEFSYNRASQRSDRFAFAVVLIYKLSANKI